MYSTLIAYILWGFSGFGALGLHRFYLRKYRSGILYFFTAGLFGIGSIYDFITLPNQVREANLRLDYRNALETGYELGQKKRLKESFRDNIKRDFKKKSIEKIILTIAKENNGIVTPSKVSLECDHDLNSAKKNLDILVNRGFAEMRVTKNGQLIYFFSDLVSDSSKIELEEM